jgi:hypothetical protein
MAVLEGAACPGCGLPNYDGLCPRCRGDQDAYERELVPPFETSIDPAPAAVRTCRVCGCTDDNACLALDAVLDRVGCHWVEADLCSECSERASDG